MAKAGSRLQQPQHPISFSIMKQTFHYVPKRRKDPVCCFERRQQTTIFCLRTGHSCLFKHMCRLGLAHIKDCPCQTGPQSPQHFLQFCPLFREARMQHVLQFCTLLREARTQRVLQFCSLFREARRQRYVLQGAQNSCAATCRT